MTGKREVNYDFPTPDIRHLEQRKFHGMKIFFKETIPATNPLSEIKWNTVDSFLSKTNVSVYISHKLEENKIDKENMHFNAILWDLSDIPNSNEELGEGLLEEGLYAYFSFSGTRENYRKFTYNIYIYMNTLPFYNLKNKNSYDLEIITKIDVDMYFFEYFLPIEKGR